MHALVLSGLQLFPPWTLKMLQIIAKEKMLTQPRLNKARVQTLIVKGTISSFLPPLNSTQTSITTHKVLCCFVFFLFCILCTHSYTHN